MSLPVQRPEQEFSRTGKLCLRGPFCKITVFEAPGKPAGKMHERGGWKRSWCVVRGCSSIIYSMLLTDLSDKADVTELTGERATLPFLHIQCWNVKLKPHLLHQTASFMCVSIFTEDKKSHEHEFSS